MTEEKKKTCFVVMPISDADGYASGHFKRVYEHIVKPACEAAGFIPTRADDVKQTNMIILDILKRIIEADIVVCDLSARNPNVMYELGIRQAFNLPVMLIKDLQTPRIFDISGLRDVEYDSSLRIDTVHAAIKQIAEGINSSYQTRDTDTHSLIRLLGISPAKLPEPTEVNPDTQLILNSLESLKRFLNPQANTQKSKLPKILHNKEVAATSENWVYYFLSNNMGKTVTHLTLGEVTIVSFNTLLDEAVVRDKHGSEFTLDLTDDSDCMFLPF